MPVDLIGPDSVEVGWDPVSPPDDGGGDAGPAARSMVVMLLPTGAWMTDALRRLFEPEFAVAFAASPPGIPPAGDRSGVVTVHPDRVAVRWELSPGREREVAGAIRARWERPPAPQQASCSAADGLATWIGNCLPIILARGPEPVPQATPPGWAGMLTDRESTVIGNLSLGLPMKEVARRLGISPRTVAFHKYNVMHRLGLRGNADMFAYAACAGLVDLRRSAAAPLRRISPPG